MNAIRLTSGSEDVGFSFVDEGYRRQTILTIPIPVAFFLSSQELECYLHQKLFRLRAKAEQGFVGSTVDLQKAYQDIEDQSISAFGASLTFQCTVKAYNLHQLWCLLTADNQFYRSFVSNPSEGIEAFWQSAEPFLMNLKYKDLIIESLYQADALSVFTLSLTGSVKKQQLVLDQIVLNAMTSEHSNDFFSLENPTLSHLMTQMFANQWKKLSTEIYH